MQVIQLTPYDHSLIGKYKSGDIVGVLLETTASGFTAVLPDAKATEKTRFEFTVIGNNNAIIKPITGQFINELNSITLAKNETLCVSSFNGRYYIFGKYSTALIFNL